jgi:endonuclease/exonuclease/phosphatase family metal-dependent hydrolase
MSKKLTASLIFFLLLISYGHAQTLRIATFNMRYDNAGDSLNPWKDRLPVIVQMVQFHDFDIFGGQELLHHQVEGLEKNLPGYTRHGVGRDDGDKQGEYSPLFFKKDKFKMLDKGNFWLSETPDKPGKGWDAALPRVCSWVQFQDRTSSQKFYVFNTHFDHRGQQARKESASLIMAQIKKIAGNAPVILMGDFNFDQLHENYTLINSSDALEDTYNLAKIRMTHNGTINGFNISSKSDRRIDHIFVTSAFQVNKYGVLTDSYFGRFPSDHFPVMVEVLPVTTK